MIRPALLALALVATLLGCNGTGNHGTAPTAPASPSSPAPTPPAPNPLAPQTYTIAIVGSSTISGPVGTLVGPVAVLVTDAQGHPVDGVNVAFRSSAGAPDWGPWGLGDTLSGDGMWTISGPGTGIAAVGAMPAVVGAKPVTAHVVPVVSSAPTPPASSNTVTLVVIGQ
jgi:hypothetical protein